MDAVRSGSPRAAAQISRRLLVAGTGLAGFVALTLVVALSAWPRVLDATVEGLVLGHRAATATLAAQAFTFLGSGPGVVAGVLVLGVVLWWRSRRLLQPALLAATVIVSAGLETMVKFVVARPRPPAGLVLGVPAVTAAFPSGHTTNGTVTLVAAAVLIAATAAARPLRRVILTAAIVLAAGIGWSRVYLGYHWCTDVIGGWLLATCLVAGLSAATAVLTSHAEGWLPNSRTAPRHHRAAHGVGNGG